MKIVAIQRCPDCPKRFVVLFDDGTELNVSAADLQTYSRFQHAMLRATDHRYQCCALDSQKRTFDQAAPWLAEIAWAMSNEQPVLVSEAT
jgi:hypothetical protein